MTHRTIYPAQSPSVVTSANVNPNSLPQASVAVATANDGIAGQSMSDVNGRASITGGVISCTWIVCDAVDTFPQSSVAVHVLVTLYSPAQSPNVVASEEVNVNSLPHASMAVAAANEGTAGQDIVVSLAMMQ